MLGVKDIVIRLILSVLLSSIIGLDRESINKPAGLRTHVLVSLASTLIMLLSLYLSDIYSTGYYYSDRLASQVISGIGFLGAGTILRRDKGIITGLTTAASLWAVAAIGLAVGAGFYIGAVLTTGLVIVTLILFQKFNIKLPSRKSRLIISLKIISIDKPGQIGKIGQILGNYNANILSIGIEHTENKLIAINMAVALESSDFTLEIVNSLENLEGVVEVFQYN
ncbi:MAG: MgtC/SapB family protein [Tissierellia bacterium]|nr:MgtC/SapB family protein [Tissierellia bacterium]